MSAIVLALLLVGSARAVEMSPVFNVRASGGQYFFSGNRGSLSGDAEGVLAPALKLDERWALLPALQVSYQGTKQAVDLVGAGTLMAEKMDYRAATKAVYEAPGGAWRFKPFLNLKYAFNKETKDEIWGRGLFDYRQWGGGIEAEYIYQEPYSLRAAVEYYETLFPNYTSLESQAALDFEGQPLARERIGDFILNSRNLETTLNAQTLLGDRLVLDGSAVMTYQFYPRQRVVNSAGDLTAADREDFITDFSAGLKLPAEFNSDLRLLGALTVGAAYDTSNQNSYDAQRMTYLPYYYNYGELRLGPSLQASLGSARHPVIAGLATTLAYRRYPYRPAQAADGMYGNASMHTYAWTTSASLSYPITPRFSLLFNVRVLRAYSNQLYQQFYQYRYTTADYLFGFSYDY